MKKPIVFLLAVLASAGLYAQEIKLADQASFTIRTKGDKDSFDILLTPGPKTVSKDVIVAASPVYVRLDGRSNSIYKEAIKFVKYDSPVTFVRVIVDLKQLNEAGTYQAVLQVWPSKDLPPVPLQVSIIHPTAKLDTVYSLHVYINGNDVRKAPFAVRETTGVSDIRQLQLSPPILPGASSDDFITFPGGAYPVAAGGVSKLAYDLNDKLIDRLPLGTTIGTMQLNAPELAAPLTIPVEIVRRNSLFYLFASLIIGLLMGAFIRHFLKNRRAVEQAKLKGYELLRQLKDEYLRVSDRHFRDSIDTLATRLQKCLQEDRSLFDQDPEKKIAEYIEATNTGYTTAKTKLDADLKTVEDDLNTFSGYFESNLPASTIGQLLKPAAAYYSAARNALTRFDAATANAQMEDMIKLINSSIGDYRTNANTLTDNLTTALPEFLPTNIKKAISDTIEAIKKILSEVADDKKSSADLLSMLEKLDTVQRNADVTIAYINKTVAELIASVYQDDGSDVMKALKSSFEAWENEMKRTGTYPFSVFKNDHVTALNAAWAALPKQRATRGAGENAAFAGPGTTSLPVWITGSTVARGLQSGNQATKLTSIEVSYARSMKNWLLYSALQLVFLSLLLCLGAYKLYAPSFIGTWDEMITIFFFGFTIDISLDNVVTLLKDKKISP